MRPSTTVARFTPPSTARRQAAIFGTIPASSAGRISASSRASICSTSESRSGQSARPSTSVRTTSLTAPSATASAAAAVSALRLCSWPVPVGRDAGDDRDVAGLQQRGHRRGVDRDDVADEADVDRLAVDDGRRPRGGEQAAVLTGEADGPAAVLVDQADDLGADLTDEHHADDVDRLSWSPAGRRGTRGCRAGSASRRSAVRRRGRRPGGSRSPEEDHVLGEGPAARVVDHGVTAVLDDDDVAVELLEPGQRPGEDGDLPRVPLGVVLAHDPAVPTFFGSRGCGEGSSMRTSGRVLMSGPGGAGSPWSRTPSSSCT